MSRPAADVMAKAPLFALLDEQARDELALSFVERRYADGEIVMRQNGVAEGMILIEEGQIAISRLLPGGSSLAVATAGPGDVIGEMALVRPGQRRSANALAKGRVRAWLMPAIQVQAALMQLRGVSLHLLRALGHTLAQKIDAGRREVERQLTAHPDRFVPRPAPSAWEDGAAQFDFRAFLPKLAAFAAFDSDTIDRTVAMGAFEQLNAGASLALSDALAIIVRGAVRESLDHGGGDYQIDVKGPGRFVGVAETLDGASIRPRYVACEASTVLRLPKASFLDIWQGADVQASKVAQAVNADLARSLDTIGAIEARISAMLRADSYAS